MNVMEFLRRYGIFVVAAIFLFLGLFTMSGSTVLKPVNLSKFQSFIHLEVNGGGTYVLTLPADQFSESEVNTLHVAVLVGGSIYETPSAVEPVEGGYRLFFYAPEGTTDAYILLNPEDNEPNPMDVEHLFAPYVVLETNVQICHPDANHKPDNEFGIRYEPKWNRLVLALPDDGGTSNSYSYMKLVALDANTLSPVHQYCFTRNTATRYYDMWYRDVAEDLTYHNIYYVGALRYYTGSWYYNFDARLSFSNSTSATVNWFTYPSYKDFSYVHVAAPGYHYLLSRYTYSGYYYMHIIRYNGNSNSYSTRWTSNFSDGCGNYSRVNRSLDAWCNNNYCYVMLYTRDCSNNTYEYKLVRFSRTGSSASFLHQFNYESLEEGLGQMYSDGKIYYNGAVINGTSVQYRDGVYAFHVYMENLGPGKFYFAGQEYEIPSVGPVYASDGRHFYTVIPDENTDSYRVIKWTYPVYFLEGVDLTRHPVSLVPVVTSEKPQLYTYMELPLTVGAEGNYLVSVSVDTNTVYSEEVSLTGGPVTVRAGITDLEPATYHTVSITVLDPSTKTPVGYYEFNGYFAPAVLVSLPKDVTATTGDPVEFVVHYRIAPDDESTLVFDINGTRVEVEPTCSQTSEYYQTCVARYKTSFADPYSGKVSVYARVTYGSSTYEEKLGEFGLTVTTGRAGGGRAIPVSTYPVIRIGPLSIAVTPTTVGFLGLVATLLYFLIRYVPFAL